VIIKQLSKEGCFKLFLSFNTYTKTMKILVVEDEHKIARAIKDGLEQESYTVKVCYDGQDGLDTVFYEEFDLIILDVMLPSIDGFEICRRIRKESIHTPILMLTAKSQTSDIVKGLDTGADDYLPKPFSFEVLLARVRALLRRPHETVGEVLQVADLIFDTVRSEVKRADQQLNLSAREYAVLEYLMRNKNKVLTKNNIINHVWDFDADILPNNLEVFISYLRNKVDKPFEGPALIKTVRGFGYKISDE
jgi:two-component system, OmpR family, response regulator